jgi:hypothetical protein
LPIPEADEVIRIGRRAVLIGLPIAVAGCGRPESIWAPDDVVARAAYVFDGPPALTLYTVKNNDTQNGAHTALMINASQRVLFDPAGSFGHPSLPERNDVIFGITPRIEEFYTSYHARASYHVVKVTREVPAEAAETAFRLALQEGPVPRARCALATSSILHRTPGFESIRLTLLPDNLLRQFQALPGTTAEFRYEDDDDNKELARAAFDAERAAARGGG